MCFAMAANLRLKVDHLDVSTAFLNGSLTEDIYMSQPDGFDTGDGKVYKLHKAVYCLQQASRCWYLKVTDVLKASGFTQSA